MARLVVLDATPLGFLCGPSGSPRADRCRAWLRDLVLAGHEIVIPEVADYEVRRELHHRDFDASLAKLDLLCESYSYLPITTDVMRFAAILWGALRKIGRPTADRGALDGDCILAAQALRCCADGDEVIIATSNVGHLGRFEGVTAMEWESVD